MRIISWNVNGIRATAKKGELENLIQTRDPDILFMQEIKATPDKLSDDLLDPLPYLAHYNPAERPGYAGTGVWVHARVAEKYHVSFLSSFPGDPNADEGRVMHVELKKKDSVIASEMNMERGDPGFGASGLLRTSQGPSTNLVDIADIIDIFGIYFPNGGKSEQAWQQKLVFYSEFAKYTDTLRDAGHHVLWGGDINCAHHAIDLARPKENDGKIGFHPLERAWLDNRSENGWHDIWRKENPTKIEVYSWWDPVTRSRERNVGWRIDAWWGSESIVAKVRNIEYLTEQYGSDHCPIVVEMDF